MSRTRVELFRFASMSLLIFLLDDKLLQDEVVKVSPPARAIRDVEDEELSFSCFLSRRSWSLLSNQDVKPNSYLFALKTPELHVSIW